MAERRMFTKKVTDDDNFMSLSASAQALYLHLSMSADDDGFCNQVSISMFKAHASVQDLQALLEKRYIYQFENGVIVIKHWRMANALRKDRYTPTAFQEELKQLELKENGSYTMNKSDVVADWLPSGCQMSATGKDRIDKDRLDKDRLDIYDQQKPKELRNEFEALWKLYPKKQGKDKAFGYYERARKSGSTYEEVEQGINDYKAYINFNEIDMQYVKQGSTFFSQKAWQDDWTIRNKKKAGNRRELFERLMREHEND